MIKIRTASLEYFNDICSTMFDPDGTKNLQSYTWQQTALANICSNLNDNNQYSFAQRDQIKKQFLSWQSNDIPNINYMPRKYTEWMSIKEFNHDDDYRWNDLNSFIDNYIMNYTIEIGCMEYNDYKRIEYMNEHSQNDFVRYN